MAAARNVSAAQSTTLRFSCRSRFANLPMLVVFPAPFTPTMKITRVPAPFGEEAMPLAPAASGLAVAFRMRKMCDLISRLSCAPSESALRSSFSRTASRISRVGFTPRSAESSAVSSFLRSEGSILRSPRKIVSTDSESAAFVLLTEFFSFSRNVGSGSFLPKREIIHSRSVLQAQLKIVAEAKRSLRDDWLGFLCESDNLNNQSLEARGNCRHDSDAVVAEDFFVVDFNDLTVSVFLS